MLSDIVTVRSEVQFWKQAPGSSVTPEPSVTPVIALQLWNWLSRVPKSMGAPFVP